MFSGPLGKFEKNMHGFLETKPLLDSGKCIK